MPMWTIFHSPGTFTDEEKHQLATRITDHYERAGLPRFYVVAVFNETPPFDFYVGGQPVTNGIRIVIDHIARTSSSAEERQQTARWIKRIMQPHIDRHEGVYWEFHADETGSELWMIDGLVPPPAGSEAEKLWARQNSATPYEIPSSR